MTTYPQKLRREEQWPPLPRPPETQRYVLACPVCACPGPRSRHHLRPLASGGSKSEANVLVLCADCHATTHRVFGEGHAYSGPTDRAGFVEALRRELAP